MIERILELKENKRISAKELTENSGLNPNAITDWKKGKGKPSADAIIKLADYFNVSADYILGRTDNANNFHASNINNNGIVGNNSMVINGHNNESPEIAELNRIFNALNVKKRMELLKFAFSLEENM